MKLIFLIFVIGLFVSCSGNPSHNAVSEENDTNHLEPSLPADHSEHSESLCRRYTGCLEYCAALKDENCSALPALHVIEKWSQAIDQFSNEQVIENLKWIAETPHVSWFLQDMDADQIIMPQLFSRLRDADCPFLENKDIYYEPLPDQYRGHLYLSHPRGLSSGVKKTAHNIHLHVFTGFVKKCFNNNQISFIEYAINYRNQRSVEMAHKALVQSCQGEENCTRLAYCKLNSQSIWDYMDYLSEVQQVFLQEAKMVLSTSLSSLTEGEEGSEEFQQAAEQLAQAQAVIVEDPPITQELPISECRYDSFASLP